jgi:glucose-6-phosphate 1-epimerase
MNSGKAIRGGIPVIFPWFGARSDGKEGPMHGFARLSEWTVESTHFSPDNEVTIVLSLDPTDFARSLGYDQFHAAVQFHIGDHLNTTLEITNHGQQPLVFEDALHTYYAVGDAQQVTVEGLQGTTYLDKVTNFTRKTQTDKLLAFHSMVDQVHLSTAAPLTIHDPAWKRDIRIEKHGSNTTVTWNPWAESTAKSTELEPDAWKNFVCVEVANASENKLTLAPGATHRMDANVTIHPHA